MNNENERAARAKKGSPFLNRALEKMRTAGSGPRFRKHGRYVRYHIDDLDEWSLRYGKGATTDARESGAGRG
ncbi:DNA-binding protein [Allomesorhizobium camelthorni]|uniref:DNA-binding protein n=1 Tax=Allomesorhizobium camelthorni TaxID=475069 RepID=A0A6G4WFU6_9HYPH|nr:DNA-binding protein [Mesorhizobium camelthorni]NGO53000.1 DNA-binding protein [Mesorhizobium camelthorni]